LYIKFLSLCLHAESGPLPAGRHERTMDNAEKTGYEQATPEELLFIRRNMPRGMMGFVQSRTGRSRSAVRYQIEAMPKRQNEEIITALREIFRAVTQMEYHKKG